jgi:hypothetical protein
MHQGYLFLGFSLFEFSFSSNRAATKAGRKTIRTGFEADTAGITRIPCKSTDVPI